MPVNSLFQRFYRKHNILIKIIFTSTISLIIIILLDFFFRIKAIKIEGYSGVILGGELLRNKNILLVDVDQFKKKLIELNPIINDLSITKQYPSVLKIYIKKNKATAVIKGNIRYLLLSESGRILEKSNQLSNFPVINYYQVINEDIFKVGDTIDYKDIKSALFYIKILSDLRIVVDRVDIVGFDMVVCKEKDREYVFSVEKDSQNQIYNISEIIKKFKVEGRVYKKIDLRFEKPVVTF